MNAALEESVRKMLLDQDVRLFEGMDERAQRLYRRQVRKSILGAVRRAIPVATHLTSAEHLNRILGVWLEQSPPQSRLYWQIAGEFAAWLGSAPDLSVPHPAFAELIHWEVLEIDVINAPDLPASPVLGRDIDDRAAMILDPSARLAIYQHPVHTLDRRSDGWPAPLAVPAFIVAWRNPSNERFKHLQVTPMLAQMVAHLHDGSPLASGWAFLEGLYGEFDRKPVLDELQRLIEGGAVAGFLLSED